MSTSILPMVFIADYGLYYIHPYSWQFSYADNGFNFAHQPPPPVLEQSFFLLVMDLILPIPVLDIVFNYRSNISSIYLVAYVDCFNRIQNPYPSRSYPLHKNVDCFYLFGHFCHSHYSVILKKNVDCFYLFGPFYHSLYSAVLNMLIVILFLSYLLIIYHFKILATIIFYTLFIIAFTVIVMCWLL